MVLGHGGHGPCRPAGAAGKGDPGGVHPPREQGLARPRAPRLDPLLPPSARLPAQAPEGGVKALDEIGGGRAARFFLYTVAMVPYRLAPFPPPRGGGRGGGG